MNDDEEPSTTPAVAQQSGLLSKSWNVSSAHVPTFTGGKVTHSYSSAPPTTSTTATSNDDEDDEEPSTPPPPPFLLLPVHGDVAIVDSKRGVKLSTIRTGRSNDTTPNDTEADDDEDDGVDPNDITSYALDHNNHSVLTCSRNSIIRQYSIEYTNTSESTQVYTKLVSTWGRSGHTLPVTSIKFHPSNIFVATGSVDGTVRIWDVRGKYVTHVYRPMTEFYYYF